MVEIKIKDCRDEDATMTGFLTATDEDRELYLHCKVFIYSDNSLSIEKFMSGNVGKYEFKCADWRRDTLFFIGRGRGRKPSSAEESMYSFLKEIKEMIATRTLNDFQVVS